MSREKKAVINQYDQQGRRHGHWKDDECYIINRHSWRSASKFTGNYVNGSREGLFEYLADNNSLVFKIVFANDEEKHFVGYNLSHKIHREVIFV